MSASPKTASQLTATLVVDTCVPIVKDDWKKEVPVPGVELTTPQRHDMGMPLDGVVMAYDLGESQVFMHFLGPTATIWYTRGDTDKGLAAVDSALKKTFPVLKQKLDIEHPKAAKQRLRVYEGNLTAERHCTVEIDYSVSGGPKRFAVRVSAFMNTETGKKV